MIKAYQFKLLHFIAVRWYMAELRIQFGGHNCKEQNGGHIMNNITQ